MTYPKCSYCTNPVMIVRGQRDPLCETCCDVEFCCNVAKDKYGTKSMAHVVALDLDLLAAYKRLVRP